MTEQKNNYHALLNQYKRSMVLLKALKEKTDRKEQQINELIHENQKLKVRAACAWEEFTPRPSFKPVNCIFNGS